MDRIAWLNKMQRVCEAEYDKDAHLYGEKYGLYSNITHQEFIQEILSLLPQGSMILDAACGAGRYLPFLLEKTNTVIGIDQSQGMLTNAEAKFPEVQFEKISLQDMMYREIFDGAICVDAMENVCPEDWPKVLRNFNRSLKSNGYLYFTAETIENADALSSQRTEFFKQQNCYKQVSNPKNLKCSTINNVHSYFLHKKGRPWESKVMSVKNRFFRVPS